MSRTRGQIRKQAKKKAREKAKNKARNIRNNLGPTKWKLLVLLDGVWMEAKRYRNWEQGERHREDTESRRKAGEVIVPGKVVDMTGEEVMSIAGTEMKGSLKDVLEGKESSVDKTKPGFLKKVSEKD